MSVSPSPAEPAGATTETVARFERLLPPGTSADAQEIVDGLEFAERAQARPERDRNRPYLILNMVATLDGRTSVNGRSGAIGNRADRELFHALRADVDAVMAGAVTARVERYGRIVADERVRRERVEHGLSAEPLAFIVSGRLSLSPDTPLLGEPQARVVIVTSSSAGLPETAAQVQYVRAARDGELDLPLAMRELRERFDVRTLVCEGGPQLNTQLLLAGVVDELFLSLAPELAGGEDATDEALRNLAGAAFAPPAELELELLGVLENESHLFLRYAVKQTPARASS